MKNIYKSDICVRCKRELRKQKKIIKQRENVIKGNAKNGLPPNVRVRVARNCLTRKNPISFARLLLGNAKWILSCWVT